MPNKKALGIDYGSKRIGLSLSDDTRTIAFPFKYISNNSLKESIAELKEIVNSENIGLIVIGMPIGLRGRQTDTSVKIDEFINEIKIKIANTGDSAEDKIEIASYDERFSTVQAQKSLIAGNVKRKKRREIVDSIASAFILQSYLDRNSKSS